MKKHIQPMKEPVTLSWAECMCSAGAVTGWTKYPPFLTTAVRPHTMRCVALSSRGAAIRTLFRCWVLVILKCI